MRYLVLVSHGTLAQGMHSVLKMLGGDSPAIKDCCLEDGMGADAFVARFKEVIAEIAPEDEVVLMGDIQGGSPLTNAMNELAAAGLLGSSVVFSGMNLPMAMTAFMGLAAGDLEPLRANLISEARQGITEIVLADDEDEEDL
ncbi:PTS sugar transporter subunit IIA [Collinsella intestinalis]|jgi:PTS system N-acetylgalactosamine-specific IIA component|uniref:PTS fructose transporter subunit IIA n=1 Tax=Collinsella intestinalis TaxID=147207 RepID=A0A414FUI9_9ACTN|nr:PTS fructose transporter subunit IIA [Collinsella intestinalis]RHD54586.1 PTS fructose transporter subunit IIA [Collinsella intestinalis]